MVVFKKSFSIIAGAIAFLYFVIFLPLAPFVAPMGLLATVYPGMSTIGAVLCFLSTSSIIVAMPISACLICVKLSEKKYLEVCLYCLLPLLVALGALLWIMFLISIHNLYR
jgi:hypothetical protein